MTANREVIVSAGAIHTPQLLKLSGIGLASELQNHSVPVLADLPGVGTNLQDHMLVGLYCDYIPALVFGSCKTNRRRRSLRKSILLDKCSN